MLCHTYSQKCILKIQQNRHQTQKSKLKVKKIDKCPKLHTVTPFFRVKFSSLFISDVHILNKIDVVN